MELELLTGKTVNLSAANRRIFNKEEEEDKVTRSYKMREVA